MALLSFVGLMLLSDGYNRIPEFLDLGAGWGTIIAYLLLGLVRNLSLLIPISLLISVIFVLATMNRTHEISAARAAGIAVTEAGGLGEVEFAVFQLAHLGQSFAQGVETGGLRLQFTHPRCQRVHLGLGVFLGLRQLAFLLGDLGVEPGIIEHAAADAGTEADQAANPQHAAQQGPG